MSESDRAAVREELERRYEATFECPPSRAPWGPLWSEVLAEARDADRAYVEAEQALADIHATLRRAARLIDGKRSLRAPYSAEARLGLTLPEARLYDGFSSDQMLLPRAFAYLELALEELRRQPVDAALHSPSFHAAMDHATEASVQEANRSLSYEEVRNQWHEAARLGTSRRLAAVPASLARGQIPPGLQLPCLLGKPPAGTDAREPYTWQRGYLVELLDLYPLRTPPSESLAFRVPDDAELAIVSLLLGALDLVTSQQLKKGTATVLDAERRAIKRARRRRAILTSLQQSGQRDTGASGAAQEQSTPSTATSSTPRKSVGRDGHRNGRR